MSAELVRLAMRAAPTHATHTTAIPELQIIRSDQVVSRINAVHRPSLCFIAQGAKLVTLGGKVYRYAQHEFLFTSVALPVTGEIVEASARAPYLCLVLEIDPSTVFDLVTESRASPSRTSEPAIFVGVREAQMSDAFLRLLRCLESADEARVLAPGIIREIVFRLLAGRYGDAVRAVGVADSQTHRIARAIECLKRDYAKPLRTTHLAKLAGMSVSSFHQHFKTVTTISPHQYQKVLRLQEARRLLVSNNTSAADAAFHVGYESPSQFSREYARMFGAPPKTDVKRRATTT